VKTELGNGSVRPNYVIFFGLEDIEQRVQHIESSLKMKFTLERRIEASFLDDVFYRLNPKNNKNQTTFVFKVTT
jgi:hypothetical protein